MPSYLVSAATVEEPERRFEYRSDEPLGPDSVFPDGEGDVTYKVWRLRPDDSGRFDGLVDADQLLGGA